MASPWSAPAWMKTSGSLIGGTLKPEYYDAFARYLLRYVDAYAQAGVPIFALTLQNEPGFTPTDYPGMRLEAAHARSGDPPLPRASRRRRAAKPLRHSGG